jgi:hypothetical protein
MKTNPRIVAAAVTAGLLGLTLVACGGNQPAPPATTTTTTPSVAPTEKSLDPSGGNLFTPQVTAQPAPTEPPGVHHHH